MRCFITGGSGFLGRELIRALTAAGHEVVALARSPRAEEQVRQAGARPAPGDIDSVDAVTTAMAGCGWAFHAAAHTVEWDSDEAHWRVNVVGTDNVLEGARRAGTRRVVLVSSEAVLADGRPIIDADERTPLPRRPVRGYPATKAEAERRTLAASKDGLETVVIRPRCIWGRGDTSNLAKLVEARDSGRLRFIDGGRYLTSTCHVANVCEGALLAAEKGRPGEVYFLTDGAPVEFRHWLTESLRTQGRTPPDSSVPFAVAWGAAVVGEAVWRALGKKTAPMATKVPVALMGQQVTVLDKKARDELGYVGRMTLDEGFAELARLPPVVPPRAPRHRARE